jgi:hypothetical protein
MNFKAYFGGAALILTGCGDSKSSDDNAGGAITAAGIGNTPSGGGGVGAAAGAPAGSSGSAGSGTAGARTSGGAPNTSGGGGAGGKALDPSVIAAQPETIDELEIDAKHVYWLEGHNRILRLPIAGGTPSVVYASTTPGKYETLHIAVDDARVFMTDQGAITAPKKPRGVFSIPLAGGNERSQLITTSTIDRIALDGEYVYFTADDSIARMPKSGGLAMALVRNIDTDTPLAIHDGYVYFAYAPDVGALTDVYRVAVDANAGPLIADGSGGGGGASGTGAAGSGGAGTIAAEKISDTTRFSELILAPRIDQGYVYWAIYDELYRFPVAGGTQEKFGVLEDGSVASLLVEGGDVFYAEDDLFGWPYVRHFVSGSSSNVVSAIEGITDFVVNESSIFVADGKLLRRVDR